MSPAGRDSRRALCRRELETIARQWISLWCAPVDWGLFDRLHAHGFEDCSAAGREPTKEAFADGLADMISAFPDLRTEAEDLVVDEAAGKVAIRWVSTGTSRATFLGKEPTGLQMVINGIEIIEVEGGKIVRRWGEWDMGEQRHRE